MGGAWQAPPLDAAGVAADAAALAAAKQRVCTRYGLADGYPVVNIPGDTDTWFNPVQAATYTEPVKVLLGKVAAQVDVGW